MARVIGFIISLIPIRLSLAKKIMMKMSMRSSGCMLLIFSMIMILVPLYYSETGLITLDINLPKVKANFRR